MPPLIPPENRLTPDWIEVLVLVRYDLVQSPRHDPEMN